MGVRLPPVWEEFGHRLSRRRADDPVPGLQRRCPGADSRRGWRSSEIDRELGAAPASETTGITPVTDQIQTLVTQLEELRFRRRHLEREHTEAKQWLQTIGQHVAVVRRSLDEIEAILAAMSARSPADTQEIG